MAEVWLGPASPELATTLNNLGALHTTEQKFSEAEEPLKRALAMREQLLGPEHPEVAPQPGRGAPESIPAQGTLRLNRS